MSIDITFDKKEADENIQLILQASIKKQAETMQKAYQFINKEIDLFIQQYDKVNKQLKNFKKEFQDTIKHWHKIKNNLIKQNGEDYAYKQSLQYQQYQDQRSKIKITYLTDSLKNDFFKMYLFSFKIHQYLNAALGYQVITAYVFETKEKTYPEIILSNKMEDFLKVQLSSSGNLVLRYRENQQRLNNHIETLNEMIKIDEENNDFKKLINTYDKIHTRFKNHPLKRKQGSFVLWLYPYGGQKWNGAHISSFSHINEGYSYFLLQNREFNYKNIEEDDVEVFMNYVLNNVTSQSGSLSGDIEADRMQIAIKTADASAMSLQEIYKLSKNIQKNKTKNFQAIVKFLQKQKALNRQKAHSLDKSYKQVLQDIVDDNLSQVIEFLEKKL